jgi:hypothetical protein
MASYDRSPMNLTGNVRPERVVGESVSAGFFDVLGVSPALGRSFLTEEDRQDAAPVVILTHDFWERRLGGDTGVLERSLMLDGSVYQVVGVLPRGFQAPSEFVPPDRPKFFVPAAYPKELLAGVYKISASFVANHSC